MGDFFAAEGGSFDAVWISEALSHFPNKPLFFENTFKVLKTGGKLALADWFKAETINETDFVNDIKPIEGGQSSACFSAHLRLFYFLLTRPVARRYAVAAIVHSTRIRRLSQECRAFHSGRAKRHQQGCEQDLVSHQTQKGVQHPD